MSRAFIQVVTGTPGSSSGRFFRVRYANGRKALASEQYATVGNARRAALAFLNQAREESRHSLYAPPTLGYQAACGLGYIEEVEQ